MDDIISQYSSYISHDLENYHLSEVKLNPMNFINALYDQISEGDRYSLTKLVEDNLERISDEKFQDIEDVLTYYVKKYKVENLTYDMKVKFYTISIYSCLPEMEYKFENINQDDKLIGIMKFWAYPYQYQGKILNYDDNIVYNNVNFRILQDIEIDNKELEKWEKLKDIPTPYISCDFVYGGKKVIATEVLEPIRSTKGLNMWIMISDICDILKKLNNFCVIESLTSTSISENIYPKYGYDFIINDYSLISFEKNNNNFKGYYKNIYSERKNNEVITFKDQVMNLLNVVEKLFDSYQDEKFKAFKTKILNYKGKNIHDYTIYESFKNCVI